MSPLGYFLGTSTTNNLSKDTFVLSFDSFQKMTDIQELPETHKQFHYYRFQYEIPEYIHLGTVSTLGIVALLAEYTEACHPSS